MEESTCTVCSEEGRKQFSVEKKERRYSLFREREGTAVCSEEGSHNNSFKLLEPSDLAVLSEGKKKKKG